MQLQVVNKEVMKNLQRRRVILGLALEAREYAASFHLHLYDRIVSVSHVLATHCANQVAQLWEPNHVSSMGEDPELGL